ncbi:alanine-rich protein [Thermobifida fusca YX]|uniref:Alanine-rich protein n=2 Tax=Thermobifida fusca TaxID=2021 RepID=A0A9P2T7D3_THEFU|nr:sigma-70 family RNA polymerase sigma factor [Thermobifida fusca]AAZ56749.1 alanine-rich protein [Thermobifida fusca YX]EOR70181.1 alanine-rich protein [Thermobifida fusca TM51]QOS59202.1 sigma-70 family RNA polymerase sigma factor [Thermobifida fusca]
MRDADIVHAIAKDERDGLSAAYRAYADRLYDYSLVTLDDAEAAADTVHDVFLIAREQIARLRDTHALRPWLYALTRAQCHRALRLRDGHPPPDLLDGHPSHATLSPDDPRLLLHEALCGLPPHEREILHLTVRHQLAGPELAAILGTSRRRADARAAAAHASFTDAVGVLLAVRRTEAHCPALRTLLQPWDGGHLTPAWRKRITRHLRTCPDCDRTRAALPAPDALRDAFPLTAPPAFLHDQLLTNAFDPGLAAHHAEFAAQAGPYRNDGFPATGGPAEETALPCTRLPAVLTLAAALLFLVLIGWAALPLLTAVVTGSTGVEAIPVVSLEPAEPPSPASSPHS